MKDMCNKVITGIVLQEDGIGFTLSDDNRDEDMHFDGEVKTMSDQSRIDVNKICRSIDALTKEIHLLRKDLNRRDRFESCKKIKDEESEADELDKMPKI